MLELSINKFSVGKHDFPVYGNICRILQRVFRIPLTSIFNQLVCYLIHRLGFTQPLRSYGIENSVQNSFKSVF